MPLNNAIPQPTDQLKVSQNDLLQNFISLAAFLGTNHANPITTNVGNHTFVEFNTLGATPVLSTSANGALYTINGAISAKPELTWLPSATVAVPVPVPVSFTEATNAALGWQRLPGGAVLKWGTLNVPNQGANPNPTTFPVNLNAIGPNYANPPFWYTTSYGDNVAATQNFVFGVNTAATTNSSLAVLVGRFSALVPWSSGYVFWATLGV